MLDKNSDFWLTLSTVNQRLDNLDLITKIIIKNQIAIYQLLNKNQEVQNLNKGLNEINSDLIEILNILDNSNNNRGL